jgi:hypothetical protein
MTGLALQCLSGRGESYLSEEFGETYLAAVMFLVDVGGKQEGRLGSVLEDKHWVYEHAIATQGLAEAMMIAEAQGVNVPGLRALVTKAGKWIVEYQNVSGGWEYSYNEAGGRGGDVSITAWQVLALNELQGVGVQIPGTAEALKRAAKFVHERQAEGGGVGYSSLMPVGEPDGLHTLTGAGLRCYQICDFDRLGARERALDYIGAKMRFSQAETINLYALYFASLAVASHDAAVFKAYQSHWRKGLLDQQLNDGSWGDFPAVAPGSRSEPIYNTCLATLILVSYYR